MEQVRKQAVDASRSTIDVELVAETLDRLQIDGRGLGPLDRAYLDALWARAGRSVGIRRVAAQLGVPAATLERDHEPHLLRLGLIAITPHGRAAMPPRLKIAR